MDLGDTSQTFGPARSPWARLAMGKLYNQGGAAVTLHLGDDEEPVSSILGERDMVRVQVSYLKHCSVPFVSAWMCHSALNVFLGRFKWLASDSMKRFQERLKHVESPTVRETILSSGERFVLIEAEARMPNQGAKYKRVGEQ
jgi:hypothetical protein